ncbi:MAG TPA: NADH-quinone oxidoreductase subunit H, partial [Thermoguttaceae bacterium]|nr:NADH-quinone oxidoreductase subunit H [Thermoguttaceae bacterium]
MSSWLLQLGFADWLAYGSAGLIKAGLVLVLVLFTPMLALWMERKIAGRIQDRLGPTRTGGRFGWLQSPADGIKLLMKEDLMPAAADPLLFRLAPYLSFCAVFCLFVVLPMADGWAPAGWDSALFFFLAVAGLEVFGVILAGYASGSKWSLFGAMREAAQVVSYEVPLGLCVVVPVVVAGSMDLEEIARMQEGWFTRWFIFHDPFTFLTFWIYAACAMAGLNRAPFDLPEAESELVAGFATEYSGFRWAVFFMAEYAAMFAWSGLGAILFFGGWNGPVPVASWLELVSTNGPLAGFLGNLLSL